MAKPKRILLIKFRALGDTVVMTAALEQVAKAYPGAEIDLAVHEEWISLFEGDPRIRKLWRYRRHEEKTSRLKAVARLILKLRKEKYDLVVNFHASTSSSMVAFGIGVKTRSIHFHGHRDRNRYSTVEIPGKGEVKPTIERDMDAIRALGVSVDSGKSPKIFLDASDFEKTEELVSAMKIHGPILAMGLGASRPTKIWAMERFAEVASRWIKETGGCVVTLTTPNESKLRRAIEAGVLSPELKDQIFQLDSLTLRELAGVLGKSSVFLGNDSGPKHLAVSVNCPTITLIGPEDPYEWHPYPRDLHDYFFVKDLPCRKDALPGFPPWCGLEVCTEEGHRCMKEISVEKVFSRVKELART